MFSGCIAKCFPLVVEEPKKNRHTLVTVNYMIYMIKNKNKKTTTNNNFILLSICFITF